MEPFYLQEKGSNRGNIYIPNVVPTQPIRSVQDGLEQISLYKAAGYIDEDQAEDLLAQIRASGIPENLRCA